LNVIFAIAPLPGVAPAYAARAREVAEASADPLAIGRVSFFAGLTALVAGRWAEGRAALERALGTARSVRDPRATEESLAVLGNAELMIGRLEDALQRYDELHETARRSGNKQGQRWALLGRAQCMLALGLAEEAIALFERCRELAEPATERRGDPAEEITQGEVARAHLLLGDGARARAVAERTLAALVTRPPSGFHLLGGYLGTTEVLLALWERATSPEERVALGQSARRACRALRAYALFFPIARPHAHRFQGLCEALSGHPARAQRAFARSLAMAERLSMPIEQGLAHYEMGRHRVVGDPARATHLDAARGIFDRLGRTHWRERCAHLLAEGRADQKGAA
jgi:tetratricopeptide (TPR) repeat protein